MIEMESNQKAIGANRMNPNDEYQNKSFFLSHTGIGFILILSALIASSIWFASKHYYNNLSLKQFDNKVSEHLARIDKRMANYENALHSGIGFFEGSDYVSRSDWGRFIEAMNLEKNYPGMQGIGFVKFIHHTQKEKLEKQMRLEGYASFTVKPEGMRKYYAPLLYLEPMNQRNIQAIGYDIYSEPIRREALIRARDTARTSISNRIKLRQEITTDDLQAGILMAIPLYQNGSIIESVEQRRKALIGYVDSAFRMDDLMHHLVSQDSIVNFEIYDDPSMSNEHLLYRSYELSSYVSKFHTQKKLSFYGKTWYFNFFSTPAFDASTQHWYSLILTVIGLLLYFSLLLIIISLFRSRQTLQKQSITLNKLSQAVEQSPSSVVITNLNGEIEYVNPTFTQITGYTKEEAFGQNPRLLKSGKTPEYEYEEMWEHLSEGKHWFGEFVNKRKDGSEYVESVKAVPIYDISGKITHYMAIKEDITEKKYSEQQIYFLANFDSLTHLPNRFQMEEKINTAIKIAERSNDSFAIMFLDLDHFKEINDTLGHSVGDILLIEIAQRFQSVIRETDSVSRFGGDEFIFLTPQSDAKSVISIAKKIISVIEQPIVYEDTELNVTASIGIALYPFDGTQSAMLVKNADIAMYRAKQSGRNNYCFFTDAMQKNSAHNLQLSNALHRAIERNELYMVYQPQIRLSDNATIGAEALIRWKHPEFGLVPPMEFIPLAEESGLILSIGEWVLRSVAQQMKVWIDLGIPPLTVAINISAVQFRHPNLADLVIDIFDDVGVDHKLIELELTEATAMHDPQNGVNIMQTLYQRGIRMSIDDFGTGYSSLSYLKKFKVYKLKIDQSFIADITTDLEDKAIVKAVISMAHALGVQTIAEGVETRDQLDCIEELGCDEVQGYYFSKPLEAKAFTEFVNTF